MVWQIDLLFKSKKAKIDTFALTLTIAFFVELE